MRPKRLRAMLTAIARSRNERKDRRLSMTDLMLHSPERKYGEPWILWSEVSEGRHARELFR